MMLAASLALSLSLANVRSALGIANLNSPLLPTTTSGCLER